MSKQSTYVNVAPAIPLPSHKTQTFTYRAQQTDVPALNSLVQIPIGRRTVFGVVLDMHHQKPSYPTKAVHKSLAVSLTSEQIQLAKWISDTMQGGLGFTLRLFYPPAPTSQVIDINQTSETALITKPTKALAYIEKDFDKRWKAIQKDIQAAQKAQVLVIVPEIWMIEPIAKILGKKHQNVWPLHAGMKSSYMQSTWQQIFDGTPGVIVGTQKALFLPFRQLQAVIVEEEQYPTHKLWDQYPRLDNRRVAQELARIHHSALIYSTSFPSLTLDHLVKQKEVKIVGMHNPVTPVIDVVATSFEDRQKHLLLPKQFVRDLHAWRRKKERVLIFYNQLEKWRGKKRSSGTATLDRIFESMPNLAKKSVRIDRQTLEAADLPDIEKAPIVIGTSAVLTQIRHMKFDRVVWLFPERMLSYPDFRSDEKAWTLLARMQQYVPSRRAVTVVTKRPQVLESAFAIPYQEWYEKELRQRRRYHYPPYTDLIRLTIKGKTAEEAEKKALQVRKDLDTRANSLGVVNTTIRGPFQDLDPKTASRLSFHILLNGTLAELRLVYSSTLVDIVDVDPQRIL